MLEGMGLKELLETVGLFIGTYGLAVFLVVYYAVKLYPELREERGEWIRQITRLRQLIDPATRPLTTDQAKTILQITGDVLADRLSLVLEAGKFREISTISASEEAVRVFDERFSYYPEEDMEENRRAQELDGILENIARTLENQIRKRRDTLIYALRRAADMARRDAYRLTSVRYGNTTLESVWTKSYEAASEAWLNQLDNSLDGEDISGVDALRRFVDRHPGSKSNETKIAKTFGEIGFTSNQDVATSLKNLFERFMEEQILIADTSETDL